MADNNKLYDGEATVTAVEFTDLKSYQQTGLTEDQVAESFNIVLTVKPKDVSFPETDIELEISPRECVGKLAGKEQKDVSLQQLAAQKLVSEAKIDCLEQVTGAVGKTVSVFQKESKDGKYINTYFSSGAAKISNSEVQRRLAMLTGRKPAAVATAVNPDPFA